MNAPDVDRRSHRRSRSVRGSVVGPDSRRGREEPAECHAKNRHVLAAAVRGGADTLLTFNVKDFPLTSTDRYGIEVAHPDRFLTRLLSERADDVIAALEFGMTEMTRPPQTMRGFLTSLATTVPTFADLATGRLQ